MIATEDFAYDHQPSALVIGVTAAACDAACTAIGHAGMRVVDTVGFADAAGRLIASASLDVIVVETAEVAPEAAEAALLAIDMIARERDIDVVVALTHDQVDLVAASLFGPHAQLLCAPSIAERVGALHWAGTFRGHRVYDSARDADERLRRLNAEVARFAETLSQLAADCDVRRNDAVLVMGGGRSYQIGRLLLEALADRWIA